MFVNMNRVFVLRKFSIGNTHWLPGKIHENSKEHYGTEFDHCSTNNLSFQLLSHYTDFLSFIEDKNTTHHCTGRIARL